MTLKNKKILVIIGGGIAAYKSLDLIRLLKKNTNSPAIKDPIRTTKKLRSYKM